MDGEPFRNEFLTSSQWSGTAPGSINYTGGNVGIGTASPAYTLDVTGDLNFTGTFRQNGSPYIGSQWTTSGTAIYYTTGNVGIGTTNPGNTLDVYQSVNGGNAVRAYNPNTGTSAHAGFIMGTNDSGNRGGIVTFNSTYTASAQYRTSGTYVYCNGAGGITLHAEGANNLFFATNSAERMRVTSAGNVGIGATNPGSALEVNGVMRFTGTSTTLPGINMTTGGAGIHWGNGYSRILDDGDLRICTDDNMHFYTGCNASSLGTERITMLNTGNVGIGTSNPGCALSFGASIANKIINLYDGNPADSVSTATNFYGFGINGGTLRYQTPDSGSVHRFYCGTTLAATISSTGINVPGVITNQGRPMSMVGKNNGDAASGIIVFNSVAYNVGSMYNSSNGRWTASVAGYYQFTYSGLSSYTAVYPNMRWNKNGSEFGWGATHFNMGGYSGVPHHLQMATSLIIFLAVNDYVEFNVIATGFYGGATIHSTACCIFLG